MKTRVVVLVSACALSLSACRSGSDEYDGPPSKSRPTAPRTEKSPANGMPMVSDYSAYLASPNSGLDRAAVEQRSNAGTVSSIDKKRAVPTFFYAQKGAERVEQKARDPQSAAKSYVSDLRELYELPSDAVAVAGVHRTIDNGRGGRIVELRQNVNGIEVYGMRMSVLMDRDNQLVAVSGNLHGSAEPDLVARTRTVTGEQALAIAMADLTATHVKVDDIDGSDAHLGRFALARGAGDFVLATPARIRQVFYPMPKELVSAYHIELEVSRPGSADSRAFSYIVAGDDGGILERKNLTVSHSYRVWADPVAPFTPMDGPFGDLSPHPTGNPEDVPTVGLVDRNLVALNGFNRNPQGLSDPWLADGAAETLGNNVDAYADHAAPTGFSEGDVRGKISAGDQFDWPYNDAIEPFADDNQIQSSIAQIFYVTNWLHDYYYDSGFNELAENAQVSNYGRGGTEGDPLLAEAQDTKGLETNNANMSTPSDGGSPRMQMYLWSGPVETIGETFLAITAPEALAGKYEVQASGFGVDDIVTATGVMLRAADAGGDANNPADGCEDLVTDVAGKIAILDRGNCPFITKAEKAQAAGAAALIIVNNNQQNVDELPPLGGSDGEIKITIPVLGVSLKTGGILTAGLQEAAVTADLSRAGRKRGPFRDGTLDNAIVAHEWGHYFHHRLSNCAGTTMCGGMSEGWGDFVALKMMMRPTDNLDGVYAKAAYSTRDTYFGIRRVPYSVDFTKNALTLQHIGNNVALPTTHPVNAGGPNAEVHNAGEIWASMLWQAYIALLKESKRKIRA